MLNRNFVTPLAPMALAAIVLMILPGCSINVKDKNKEGEGGRVDIKTPMGDIHVNEQPDIRETGLSLYAGAKPAPKEGHDEKSANVNISAMGFALKVVAAEFQSDDSPDKIIAYYDKELQRFGKPIQCHGRWNGGDVNAELHKKDKDKDSAKPVSCRDNGSGDSVELKVGTEENQHIVAVKPEGKGTRFALVYVRTHTGNDNTI